MMSLISLLLIIDIVIIYGYSASIDFMR